MKKPRGKQPTKPDVKKALISKSMELKGAHKATFTIPVIYRRTFNWDSPEVEFVPINHRCFLVYRGDLETEEYRRDMYTKLKLDINDLPTYSKKRLKSQDGIEIIELKEAILAMSLKNRYVEITLSKPKNKDLFKILKKDMEELADELGFEYSSDREGIKCTFKFPKHDIKYYAMESKLCVQNALSEIKHFCTKVEKNKFEGALNIQEELLYNIERLEILMDRYYSDSLNIIWDLPNISAPGYFLWINACELILDEILFITKETANALKILKPEDIQLLEMERDIFGYVWEKATEKCLLYCSTAISTIELDTTPEIIETAYSLISDYEEHRKKIDMSQSKFIKLFTGEDRYFQDPKSAQRLMAASFHLNNIFQASERIIGFSNSIVKNTLRLSKL
jgi:hypothetical protein